MKPGTPVFTTGFKN